MKIQVTVLFTLALAGRTVAADIFRFQDIKGFKTCMATQWLEEQTKTDTGMQKRHLNVAEVQTRCVDSAATLLKDQNDKGRIAEFIAVTKTESAPENALPLVLVLVSKHRSTCNDIANYEVFLRGLSGIHGRLSKAVQSDLRKALQICIKDLEFRADFLEEKDNSDAEIRQNACEFLKSEKLIKKC